jgi:DNA replication and repair protein RecF
MSGVIADYERALKQRNSLLKARAPQSSLEPWDEHLAHFGSEVLAARVAMIESLRPFFTSSYASISKKKSAHFSYKSTIEGATKSSSENKIAFIQRMKELQNQERERGLSLVGPHRDDLLLFLGDQPVKGYASHGESWSIALSLRLASYQLLQAENEKPILILDDVFSELDEERRERLTEVIETAEQTIITVAVNNDLPREIIGKRYRVTSGQVTPL